VNAAKGTSWKALTIDDRNDALGDAILIEIKILN